MSFCTACDFPLICILYAAIFAYPDRHLTAAAVRTVLLVLSLVILCSNTILKFIAMDERPNKKRHNKSTMTISDNTKTAHIFCQKPINRRPSYSFDTVSICNLLLSRRGFDTAAAGP